MAGGEQVRRFLLLMMYLSSEVTAPLPLKLLRRGDPRTEYQRRDQH